MMESASPLAPRWAQHIEPAILALQQAAPDGRNAARAELWQLLHAALFAAARAQAGRVAPVSREDLEDIASGKALELLQQAEGKGWRIEGRAPQEVAGFVARVARNGLVDLARRRGREVPPPAGDEGWEVAASAGAEAGPLELTIAEEFLLGLKSCVEGLASRARRVWMQRVLLERPSREVAGALGLSVANVDVMAQRARAALTACMAAKGHTVSGVDARAFVSVWASADPASWTGVEAEA
jgi:RNA polymerase sigma factor (sigma-70 family)